VGEGGVCFLLLSILTQNDRNRRRWNHSHFRNHKGHKGGRCYIVRKVQQLQVLALSPVLQAFTSHLSCWELEEGSGVVERGCCVCGEMGGYLDVGVLHQFIGVSKLVEADGVDLYSLAELVCLAASYHRHTVRLCHHRHHSSARSWHHVTICQQGKGSHKHFGCLLLCVRWEVGRALLFCLGYLLHDIGHGIDQHICTIHSQLRQHPQEFLPCVLYLQLEIGYSRGR